KSETNSEASSLLPKRSQSASTIARLPFHYDAEKSDDRDEKDLASRYRYYSRLDPRSNGQMRMPHHVAPANFFSILPFGDGSSKQGSLVTIFSIWNAMVGSALLSMPWALNQAGFFLGVGLFCGMPLIAFYTAYLIIKIPQGLNLSGDAEFPDICRYFWGRRMERFATSFSLVALFGGVIVYWILMSNFLFGTGTVIHDSISPMFGDKQEEYVFNNTCEVICVDDADAVEPSTSKDAIFHKFWQLKTVPVYLAVIVLPLLMFKDATFFQKFNGAGTISVIYIIVFVLVKAFNCGIHMNFTNDRAVEYAKPADNHFWSLTGTLSLSLFLHNAILSIMRHQRNPENNVRDLSWAFVLTSLTYFIVGVVFYITKRWVLVLNVGVLIICIMFAVLLPTVGTIIRFVGSIIGLVYMFVLPCAAYLKKLQMNGALTTRDVVVHSILVALGVVNCIGQFLIF
uniref:Amino acid transporter transmembrane domain-containing protein n=1 Tax=Plectus sambesii TaxID=2011161 RepID=A0A914URW5_9BILA